ncbi:DUF2905 domain-containing protein [Venenivibrio stagnispumantis]|uniref:DUF2905 domain-containing protein n=1 Tax=Venenivibrio stagnispumantis TaxID=407998 RepID=A0AA45WMU5_9AQUI|nr:DUF2905 domain-containing protein [Venenivibrio stagnispumantis]MCW4573752.1 DUF2905 domain-containing protein [Venenivibrio stagnispumantis]SMP15686.1 Protein of unknown function [Venenivibrio stagnispumantis]
MGEFGKILIFVGFMLVIVGLMLTFFEKLPFSIGRLPGDIYIEKENFRFYFPITTSILLSILLSVIFYIIGKFLR